MALNSSSSYYFDLPDLDRRTSKFEATTNYDSESLYSLDLPTPAHPQSSKPDSRIEHSSSSPSDECQTLMVRLNDPPSPASGSSRIFNQPYIVGRDKTRTSAAQIKLINPITRDHDKGGGQRQRQEFSPPTLTTSPSSMSVGTARMGSKPAKLDVQKEPSANRLSNHPPRLNEPKKKKKVRTKRVSTTSDIDDTELDGFVDVPPSFTLPKFQPENQRGPKTRRPSLQIRSITSFRSSSSIEPTSQLPRRMTSTPGGQDLQNQDPLALNNPKLDVESLDAIPGLGLRLSPRSETHSADAVGISPTTEAPPQVLKTSTRSRVRAASRALSVHRNSAAPPSRRVSTLGPSSDASYHAGTESERSISNSFQTDLPPISLLTTPGLLSPSSSSQRPHPFLSTSTRTTESNGETFESAQTSFQTQPVGNPTSPPLLPPISDSGSSSGRVNRERTYSSKPRSRRPPTHLLRPRLDSLVADFPNEPAGRAGTDSAHYSSSERATPIPATTSVNSNPMNETRTLASLYMVCGLPKDPQCWTLAQPDHLPAHLDGAVPRFWRPEVLGTTLSGQDADLLSSELDKRRGSRTTISSGKANSQSGLRPPRAEIDVPRHSTENGLGKEELARVQAKAMKLAFSREVEVIASTVQPSSTTHCFSFTVPFQTRAVTDATGAIGQQWDLGLADAVATADDSTNSNPNGSRSSKAYYGACLQVWSHADRQRSEAIRRAVEEGSKAKSAAIARAVKAAAAGKRFGARLQRATTSAMGALPTPDGLAGRNWSGYASTGGETDTDTEAFCSESEWDGPASMLPVANVPGGTPFWLPYCLILISRIPIYDLMADHLRISWARYHQAIGKHSQQMLKMLNFPCPKAGETVKMPVGATQNSASSTYFMAKIPGKTDLLNGGLEEVDFTMWPVFKSLSLAHIVSIYELALSPMGRVVFFSRYPAMLNMAVETFRVLLELRGWQGLCQSTVHARDVKIYLEDPGPYLLGMSSQLRPIAANVPPEIMVVDLDTDNVTCPKPHPQAYSKGSTRMKIERRLEEALGTLGGVRAVPSEFHEAFPGGRFRPFSAVVIKDSPAEAERLLPPTEWKWDQTQAVIAFDHIMSKVPRRGLAKVFRRQVYRQAAQLDPSAQHVQEIVRKHTTGFVDRRDMLETKIWKLNRRLAFLMAESMEWKQHFDVFQKFADKLSVESQDLKTRLEIERRDHHKLTGVVSEQKSKQAELESRLLETEQAWMAAQIELAKAQDIREDLERQKQIMVTEMKSIALGDNDQTILETIVPRVENSYNPSRASPNDSASLTTGNLRRLSAQADSCRRVSSQSLPRASPLSMYRGVSPHSVHHDSSHDSPHSMEHLSGMNSQGVSARGLDDLSEFDASSEAESGISGIDERALLSRTAVIETMRSIQARLETALRTAGQLDEEELKSYDVGEGNRRQANSRMSTESRDSRIIVLQRARKKPTINENDGSSPDSMTREIELSLSRAGSLSKAGGVPLSRRSDPRTSAVSILRPGSSIFDRTTASSISTELTTPDHTSKLETVIDGNELEELNESGGSQEQPTYLEQTPIRRQFSSSPDPEPPVRTLRRSSRSSLLELPRSCMTPSFDFEHNKSDLRSRFSVSPVGDRRYLQHQSMDTDAEEESVGSVYEDDDETFMSAAEDEEGPSELSRTLRKQPGRLLCDVSRASMVGLHIMNEAGENTSQEVDQPVLDELSMTRSVPTMTRTGQLYSSVTPRGSFMSNASSTTVRRISRRI